MALMLPAMYTSPDDARSDLFLSGAVYLFGPLVLGGLLGMTGLTRLTGVGLILQIVLPLAVTVLVPYLLMRYRSEPLARYGLGAPHAGDTALGALLAVPLAVASLIVIVVLLGAEAEPLGLLTAGGTMGVIGRLARWWGLVLLAVYVTVKARDAFRQDYLTAREGLVLIGRWVVIVAAGALLLLLASGVVRGGGARQLVFALMPLGLAGSFVLVARTLRGPSVTSRQTLLTPTVLLALGPFALSLSGERLLSSVYDAALAGGVGLMVGVLVESGRSAWSSLGLGAVVALATLLGGAF